MGKPASILFVSHMANRSGAPALLLDVIRAYRRETGLPVKVLVMRDGPLVADFKKEGTTYTWENPMPAGRFLLTRTFSKLYQGIRTRLILRRLKPLSVVFLNTFTLGGIQERLLPFGPRFITYAHELEAGIHFNTDEHSRKIAREHTDLFLAGSHAVRNNLIEKHGLPAEKIRVYHSIVPIQQADKNEYLEFRREFLRSRGIPENAVFAGIVAEREWRKGSDLFLPLISVIHALQPESRMHFLWIGHRAHEITDYQERYDLDKQAWGGKVHIIPHGPEYLKYLSLLDIHVMLSREDPYPLVMLNAAAFSTPTVCFEGSGGPPEFVGADAGVTVPYGDILAMARVLNELGENEERRKSLGEGALRKLNRDHDMASTMRRIVQEINSLS